MPKFTLSTSEKLSVAGCCTMAVGLVLLLFVAYALTVAIIFYAWNAIATHFDLPSITWTVAWAITIVLSVIGSLFNKGWRP